MYDHEKYMKIALDEAKQAHRKGDFPVGCVIVNRNGIVATGCREHSRDSTNELDHAEIVALRKGVEKGLVPGDEELVAYSTMEPCLMCFSTLILNNVRTIVYAYEDVMGGGTNLPLQTLSPLYASMDVTVIPHIMRNESLEMFKDFFQNPENLYWDESLLCTYTLAQ